MDVVDEVNDQTHANGNAAPVVPPTTSGMSEAQRRRLRELMAWLRQIAPQTPTPARQRRSRLASYLRGVGSVVDIFPARRVHRIELPKVSIAEAMRDDFHRIGRDLYNVVFASAKE